MNKIIKKSPRFTRGFYVKSVDKIQIMLYNYRNITNITEILNILNIIYNYKILNILNCKEKGKEVWTNAYSREDLGMFLQASRRERGISQKEMSRKLGFSPVTLSALETGKNVSFDKVEKYLQMLGYRLVVVPKSANVEVRE